MEWIESIARVGTKLTPIILDSHGNRREGRLGDLRSILPARRKAGSTQVDDLPLRSLRRVSAYEYVQELGLPDADPDTHDVFCLDHNGRRLLIPAAVLLAGLVSRLSETGDLLLSAGSLDQVASPVVVDDQLRLVFHPLSRLSRDGQQPSVLTRFCWLTCYASARNFWASVYNKGCRGVFGIELPNATVRATFYAFKRRGGTDWVSRMSVQRITPLEPALPFATSYAPAYFCFENRRLASSKNIRAHLKKSYGNQQEGNPVGPAGWHMTDDEWTQVVSRLHLLNHECRRYVRKSLDAALQKYATGSTWAAVCGNNLPPKTTYARWQESGKWDALKSILRDLRAHVPQGVPTRSTPTSDVAAVG